MEKRYYLPKESCVVGDNPAHQVVAKSVLDLAATMILPMGIRPNVEVLTPIGWATGKVLAIESEDGSGRNFNVTLIRGFVSTTYFVKF